VIVVLLVFISIAENFPGVSMSKTIFSKRNKIINWFEMSNQNRYGSVFYSICQKNTSGILETPLSPRNYLSQFINT
jgi:hypothetical protein